MFKQRTFRFPALKRLILPLSGKNVNLLRCCDKVKNTVLKSQNRDQHNNIIFYAFSLYRNIIVFMKIINENINV